MGNEHFYVFIAAPLNKKLLQSLPFIAKGSHPREHHGLLCTWNKTWSRDNWANGGGKVLQTQYLHVEGFILSTGSWSCLILEYFWTWVVFSKSSRAKPCGDTTCSLQCGRFCSELPCSVCGLFPPSQLGPGHCYFRNMRVMDEWLVEETLLSPATEEIGALHHWKSGRGTSFLRHHQLSMQDVQ